jgi:hypothetical protein
MYADMYQILTMVFGLAVILSVVTDYNGYTNDENHIQRLIEVIKSSLPYFFASYALLCSEAKGKQSQMYKNLILGVAIFAWIVVITNPVGSGTNWQRVSQNSALYLAQGSFIALPLVIFVW